MFKFCIFVLATARYASSGSVRDANAFVDTILIEKMPLLVWQSPRLHPYATIEDFQFKVPSNRITNRGLKVNMTHGEIRGLETAVQRLGDCKAPYLRRRQTVVICDLELRGLNITFTSLVKGDSLFATWKTIRVNVAVTDSLIQFEANAPIGQDSGSVRVYVVKNIQLDVTHDGKLNLNKRRRDKFVEKISSSVRNELASILFEYMELLDYAVKMVPFPKA